MMKQIYFHRYRNCKLSQKLETTSMSIIKVNSFIWTDLPKYKPILERSCSWIWIMNCCIHSNLWNIKKMGKYVWTRITLLWMIVLSRFGKCTYKSVWLCNSIAFNYFREWMTIISKNMVVWCQSIPKNQMKSNVCQMIPWQRSTGISFTKSPIASIVKCLVPQWK